MHGLFKGWFSLKQQQKQKQNNHASCVKKEKSYRIKFVYSSKFFSVFCHFLASYVWRIEKVGGCPKKDIHGISWNKYFIQISFIMTKCHRKKGKISKLSRDTFEEKTPLLSHWKHLHNLKTNKRKKGNLFNC